MNTGAEIAAQTTAPDRASESSQAPRFVAVEGPIGVGKTTLAQRLGEHFGYPLLLEPATDNPFLDRFYREGRRHALPTQLYFLLNRARQLADLARDDLLGSCVVADFLLEKDELFARMTLDDHEYALYRQIRDSLDVDPPRPDLVIYLQAPVGVLLSRIRRRGIDYERDIEAGYLETLNRAYTEFFHYYDAAPLLVVNASEIDFAHNDTHFDALLGQLAHMDGLRQYFNPHPTLL